MFVYFCIHKIILKKSKSVLIIQLLSVTIAVYCLCIYPAENCILSSLSTQRRPKYENLTFFDPRVSETKLNFGTLCKALT